MAQATFRVLATVMKPFVFNGVIMGEVADGDRLAQEKVKITSLVEAEAVYAAVRQKALQNLPVGEKVMLFGFIENGTAPRGCRKRRWSETLQDATPAQAA